MPPQLALFICLAFIAYLFREDFRRKEEGVSGALWIPLIWMFLAGSRYVSQWFNLAPPIDSGDAYLEGSPVDRWVFTALMVAGALVLVRRKLSWTRLFLQNKWIWLYFLFGGISVAWSAYPFVSFKRWVKALGNVIMALVVLTEKRPYASARALLRRLGFLLVPLSILFIKYYPHLGRGYHRWTHRPMFSGVSGHKNGLGALCLVSGSYFLWSLFQGRGERLKLGKRLRIPVDLVFLAMIAWLLNKADSATSLGALFVVAGLLAAGRLPFVAGEPRRIMALVLVVVALFGVLEVTLDASDFVVGLLGRDPDLTTRVPMWEGLLEMAGNPLVGVGYESFWLGGRLEVLWDNYGNLNQAHNGYLETYLNVGLIGLGLMVASLLSGLLKVRRQLEFEYSNALLRLSFIVAVALYNWTEAAFHGVSNMWLLFFLGILETSAQAWEEQPSVAGKNLGRRESGELYGSVPAARVYRG